MFQSIGTLEIILIILVLILLFGAKKIPELAKSIGKSINEFKKGAKDVEGEVKNSEEEKKKK